MNDEGRCEIFDFKWTAKGLADADPCRDLSFGFVALIGYFEKPEEVRAGDGMDTLIPAGFLLIPIEVQNYESLDSLLGKIWRRGSFFKGDGQNGRLVARNVRILRAPHNPSHFAVLAPENQAASILAQQGNFYVAMKAPNQNGTQIVDSVANKREPRRIHFDGD